MPGASSVSSLFGDLDVEAQADAPIGTAMTWYGIGGKADLLIRPRTVDALSALMKRCYRSGTPLRVLGSGANLLVGDDGVDGIVVKLEGPAFTEIKYNTQGQVHAMKAMAGADMARIVMDAARRGLEGLSQMAGIPATAGGAIRMNAGGAYGAIGDAVESVTCLTRTGEKVTYPAKEIKFGYRGTNIPDPVILSGTFRLTPTDPIKLRERVKEIFAYKKSTQPLADHSAGCTFKNPIDPVSEQRVPAGKLIDEAGLKGLSVGGATVSDRHANFVVTKAGATANDVLKLLEMVKKRVYEAKGIELQEEIAIWRRGVGPKDRGVA
ncbi:MAG: UDP-N-acetylmuramate dehydrogenase [Phycisphaerales bacterium]|nr:UDP-N-acetylmuramate dehydrogenase [Phycisphaerales bacterium]MCI0676309.1 UDP-N-acetylmuramate dehydrogenase [Phycisphaerales bacterium]